MRLVPPFAWSLMLLCACSDSSDDGKDDADTSPADADADTDSDADTDTDTDADSDADTDPTSGALVARVVTSGLEAPFEVVWGSDDWLWVTERVGKRVTRVSPVDGTRDTVLTIGEVLVTEGTQDGLLGLAFDPDFGTGNGSDHAFVAYTYDADPAGPTLRQTKIVRFTWDGTTLGSPMELISGMPGSNDHNSGRLLFGPDGMLYYSIGDQGHNQNDNACSPILAQALPTDAMVAAEDWSLYQGKVLRMMPDGSIPVDNPVLDGVRSHVWTYGHRNPQGLAFAADGSLYEAEHGPKTDDELNRLVGGMNYGWPHIAGTLDDKAYVYANWSESVGVACEDLVYSDFVVPPSVPVAEEHAFSHPDFTPPVRTFYSVDDDYDFQDPLCADDELYFLCWPTIAPSSIALYEGGGLAWLDDAVLVTSLKLGTLYRVPLDAGGDPMIDEDGVPEVLYHSVDRYRRITLDPDGTHLYVATDPGGYALGDDGMPTDVMTNPGAILELTPGP